jgi:CRP-like cAMP-binding protein
MITSEDPMKVFGTVRALDVRSLAGPVVDVRVPAGAHLVREGHVIGTFFVIRSGSAELWHRDRRVKELGTGDCFGEIDPTPTPQSYSVIASSAMRLLTFSAFGISRLCATLPDARQRLLDFLPQDSVVEQHLGADRPHRHVDEPRARPIRSALAVS